MKTLIQIVIVAMFGIEICSPFFLGYLNQQQKLKNAYSAREIQSEKSTETITTKELKKVVDLEDVDFSGNNYSDSKTLVVKE
jgi:hypothetical protein